MSPFPPLWFPFGVNLWLAARLLPLFSRRQVGALLDMATPKPGARAFTTLSAERIVAAVKDATARPWRMRGRRCLREGLLAFHYLMAAGHAPKLHFAVEPDSLRTARPRAHCWITLGGKAAMNPPSPGMLELFAYDGLAAVPATNTFPDEPRFD